MFAEKINKVTFLLRQEFPGRNSVSFLVSNASIIWCNQLDIPVDITNYILQGYENFSEIKEVTTYIYQECKLQESERNFIEQVANALKEKKLYYLTTAILNKIRVNSEPMKIIVIISFCVTAIGYFIYKSILCKNK